MTIERSADDVAQAFLLERELFEGRAGQHPRRFTAEVSGLVAAGAFCVFGDFEGFVPVRRLGEEWWNLNEQGTMLLGSAGGRVRLGDQLEVVVRRIEKPRGRVELDLAR